MITQYLAMLTLGSFAAVLLITLSSFHPASRRWWVINLGPGALIAAAVVAVVTMSGSLYMSEVLHYQPCRLCWVQRGFAYPLALLLPVALIIRRRWLHRIAIPLSVLGAMVSAYHVALERFPSLETSSTCDPTNPCSLIWVRHFSVVTIPTMALASFLLQITLAIVGWNNSATDSGLPERQTNGAT
jgi:disulfide bond formation protein DsbB